MQLSSKGIPKVFKLLLATLIVVAGMFGPLAKAVNSSNNIAYAKDNDAGDYESGNNSISPSKVQDHNSLSGKHTYSDIYASIIFSLNKPTGHASDASISYDDIKKYPTVSDSQDEHTAEKEAVYGHMPSNQGGITIGGSKGESNKTAGKQFVNIVKTLYHYDYLVPAPKDSNKENSISTFLKAVILDDSKSKTKLTMSKLLDTASIGAGTYDMFIGIINKLEKFTISLNIPELFKLPIEKGTTDSAKYNNDNNFINNSINKTLNSMGFDAKAVKTLQYLFYSVIIIMFISTLIWAFRNNQAKNNSMQVLKRRAIPIFVIIMTIPITIMLHKVMDEIGGSVTNAVDNNPNQFNSHYVVDTLEWAATSNLNLGLIRPGAGISDKEDIPYMKRYEPTPSRINKMMNNVNTNAVQAGITDRGKTAKSLIGEISSQKAIDVNNYLNAISKEAKSQYIAASYIPDTSGQKIERGIGFDSGAIDPKKDGGSNYTFTVPKDAKAPMFFFKNENYDKKFSKAIKDNMSKNGANGDYSFHKENGSVAKKARNSAMSDNGYPIKWVRVTDNILPFSENGPVNYINIKQTQPEGYIYGAGLSGSANDQNTQIGNYIDSVNNDQKINFITGDKISGDASKVYKDIGSDKDDKDKNSTIVTSKDYVRDARINSLRIALMNRYGGITTSSAGGNTQSLSTQSVVFLLQTTNNGKNGLMYQGQNAIPTDQGAKKNSGKNGNGFVRYTIPNKSYSDLLSKAGAINIVWITSGVVAVITLLYLLRAPIFGAIAKMFKGFLSALFMGRLAGLLTYCAFYVALRASFIFAKSAIVMGTTISTSIVSGFDQLNAIFGVLQVISGGASAYAVMAFALVLCAILIWPVAELQIGNKPKRVSVIGIIVMLPYIVAESLEETFNTLQSRITGKSTRGGIMQGRMRKVGFKETAGNMAKNTAKVGAGAALLASTGGASAGVGMGLRSTLGGAAKMGLGKFGEMIGGASEGKSTLNNLTMGKDGKMYDKDGNEQQLTRSQKLLQSGRSQFDEGRYKMRSKFSKNDPNEFEDDINLNENSSDQNNIVGSDPTKPKNPDNIERKEDQQDQSENQNSSNNAKDDNDENQGTNAKNGNKPLSSDMQQDGENIEEKVKQGQDGQDGQDAENNQNLIAKNDVKDLNDVNEDPDNIANENVNNIENHGDVTNENVETITTNNDTKGAIGDSNEKDVDNLVPQTDKPETEARITNADEIGKDQNGNTEQRIDNQQVAKSEKGFEQVKDQDVAEGKAGQIHNENSETNNAHTDQSQTNNENIDQSQTNQQQTSKANTENASNDAMANRNVEAVKDGSSNIDKLIATGKVPTKEIEKHKEITNYIEKGEQAIKRDQIKLDDKREQYVKLANDARLNPNNADIARDRDSVAKEIRDLGNNISKNKGKVDNAQTRLEKTEKTIERHVKGTNTIRDRIKESKTVQNTVNNYKGTREIASGIKGIATGEYTPSKLSKGSNSNNASQAQARDSLENRRERADERRRTEEMRQQTDILRRMERNSMNRNNK